jgi:hypothetical protein
VFGSRPYLLAVDGQLLDDVAKRRPVKGFPNFLPASCCGAATMARSGPRTRDGVNVGPAEDPSRGVPYLWV